LDKAELNTLKLLYNDQKEFAVKPEQAAEIKRLIRI